MNHFKTEITSACLDEQIYSDPDLDPNYNYNITEAKQKHLQCQKVKFNKQKIIMDNKGYTYISISISICIAKKNLYHSQFQKYIFNIKTTWSVIRNIFYKNNSKSSLPDIMRINNCLIKDKETIAHSFNKYFANIGSTLVSGLNDVPDNSHMNYLNDPVSTFFHFKM